jgi:hypothetical protein
VHRHARGLLAPFRAPVEGLGRRPRRYLATRAQPGRDQRSYELMGQLRPLAVPARRQRAAPLELRRRVEVRDRRRRVTRYRATRDRQVSGRERGRNGDGADRASGTAELSQRRRSDRTLTGSVAKRSSRRRYGRKGGPHEEIAISP